MKTQSSQNHGEMFAGGSRAFKIWNIKTIFRKAGSNEYRVKIWSPHRHKNCYIEKNIMSKNPYSAILNIYFIKIEIKKVSYHTSETND